MEQVPGRKELGVLHPGTFAPAPAGCPSIAEGPTLTQPEAGNVFVPGSGHPLGLSKLSL